jgi:hypothetical protein
LGVSKATSFSQKTQTDRFLIRGAKYYRGEKRGEEDEPRIARISRMDSKIIRVHPCYLWLEVNFPLRDFRGSIQPFACRKSGTIFLFLRLKMSRFVPECPITPLPPAARESRAEESQFWT